MKDIVKTQEVVVSCSISADLSENKNQIDFFCQESGSLNPFFTSFARWETETQTLIWSKLGLEHIEDYSSAYTEEEAKEAVREYLEQNGYEIEKEEEDDDE